MFFMSVSFFYSGLFDMGRNAGRIPCVIRRYDSILFTWTIIMNRTYTEYIHVIDAFCSAAREICADKIRPSHLLGASSILPFFVPFSLSLFPSFIPPGSCARRSTWPLANSATPAFYSA